MQILALLSQLSIRFAYFTSWPLALVRMVDPSESEESQRAIAHAFWNASPCCKHTAFGSKIMDLFASADAMFENTDWKNTLRLLAKKFKICNMHTERQFALIKKSYAHIGGAPEVERVCGGGLVTQVLSMHLAHGGADPRFTTSSKLLASGVPLRRAKRRGRGRKGCKTHAGGGFLVFTRAQERIRKATNISLASCGGRKQRFQELSCRWRKLSRAQRTAYDAEAKRTWALRRCVVAGPEPSHGHASFWSFSNHDEPFAEEDFVKTIKAKCGGDLPGCRKYLSAFREDLRKAAFIADQNDIPPGAKFTRQEACWRLHPGMCATFDADVMGKCFAMAKRMRSALEFATGDACKVHCGTLPAPPPMCRLDLL
jgi:hypothetical protein